MLKVVVFDSGYGGEFFADDLEEALPIVEVIRVIDWRNADAILRKPKQARRLAENALRPYLGQVDLIIFANHLLSATSLTYFKRKYKKQNFLGFQFMPPDTFIDRGILPILTTKATAKTFQFRKFIKQLQRRTKILTMDSWPSKIDDGELKIEEIRSVFKEAFSVDEPHPQEIILGCSQFNDIKKELREVLGHNVKIYDSFDDAIRRTCKLLGLRGGNGKKYD